MVINDDFSNYDTCDLIAEKFRRFSWKKSSLDLEKEVIDFINAFAEKKFLIAILSVYILYDAIEEKELGEAFPLDKGLISKFRNMIFSIVRFALKSLN
ncbi:hypothetical protein [Xenorhabdus sp. KK7.4]|uniref:hypothetical protein n=1 Tax=Xenorhabdus sp. KK7.4 TaxID=1851572 RepID=UPI000C056B4D|nr:hypothetical protein [Xenorhabdus sp. KK7.4]PHM51274.1 hypothetical protein Xekk_03847 [Xenorhabdus sp. KK7.4]